MQTHLCSRLRLGVAPSGESRNGEWTPDPVTDAGSGRQSGTALGTARIDHLAATARCHPGAKSVGTCPLDAAGLKCTFHDRLVRLAWPLSDGDFSTQRPGAVTEYQCARRGRNATDIDSFCQCAQTIPNMAPAARQEVHFRQVVNIVSE